MLRTKTDRADGKLLIEYGKHFQSSPWKHREDCCIELQQLLNFQSQLVGWESAVKNQLKGMAHSIVQNDFVKRKLHEQLTSVQSDTRGAEKESGRLIRPHGKDNHERLPEIPGIGRRTAIALPALTGGMENFDSARRVISYFSLSPRIYELGTSVGGKRKSAK